VVRQIYVTDLLLARARIVAASLLRQLQAATQKLAEQKMQLLLAIHTQQRLQSQIRVINMECVLMQEQLMLVLPKVGLGALTHLILPEI
jgi:hypothetical protein